MEHEFACQFRALDHLVPGDANRHAQFIHGKRNLPADLRGVRHRWIEELEQPAGQLRRQLPLVEDDDGVQSEYAALLRFLHPEGQVDAIDVDDRLGLPGPAYREGRVLDSRREGWLKPLTWSRELDVERQFHLHVNFLDLDR